LAKAVIRWTAHTLQGADDSPHALGAPTDLKTCPREQFEAADLGFGKLHAAREHVAAAQLNDQPCPVWTLRAHLRHGESKAHGNQHSQPDSKAEQSSAFHGSFLKPSGNDTFGHSAHYSPYGYLSTMGR
jgi:hypothetical protein